MLPVDAEKSVWRLLNESVEISTVNAGHLSLVSRPNAVIQVIEAAVDVTT